MTATTASGFPAAVLGWVDRNILALGREMRLSYLPPLMVYAAAGISGLTSVVGTFYVKERLGLTAEFLADEAVNTVPDGAGKLNLPSGQRVAGGVPRINVASAGNGGTG